ncbi:MAG: alpha/beta hydrolase [Kurthia sp.]|nr:alpha/beta hydrolase [Candidatus Kurthia equi]
MTNFNLLQQSKNFINDYSNTEIFTYHDGLVGIDRTLPKQRKIRLPQIDKIINASFMASDGVTIATRIYLPVTTKQKLPLIIYYHGGGWVIGDLDYMDGGCQYLAMHSEAIVISIDYRLAPEHPYPIPQNDAYEGFLWAVENHLQLPIDSTKVGVAGDSAGGNLAAAVAVRALEENGPKIHKQLLIYPALDATKIYPSYEEFGHGLGLDADEMHQYYEHYVQKNEQLQHPYISPKLFTQKELLPETIIVAAEYDVLNDEGIEYINELEQAGVVAEHFILPGLIHSFFSKMNYFEQQTNDATALLADFFRR